MLWDVKVNNEGKMFNIRLLEDGGNVITENGIWNNVFEIELFVGEESFELGLYDAFGEYVGATSIKEWGAFDLNDNPIDMDEDEKVVYFIDNGKLTDFLTGTIIDVECDGEEGIVKVYEYDDMGMKIGSHKVRINLSYDDSESLSNVLSMMGRVSIRSAISDDNK